MTRVFDNSIFTQLLENGCNSNYEHISNKHHNTHDFFTSFMIIFSMLQLSILIGTSLVAIFVYKPMREHRRLTSIPETDLEVFFTPKDVIYEERYNIKKAKNTISPDEINPNSYVMENTPQGNVLMKYDKEEEGFLYWCDNSNIKYKYLQVVARKYVIQSCCKEVYVGYEEYDNLSDSSYDSESFSDIDSVSETETKTETQKNSKCKSTTVTLNDENSDDIEDKTFEIKEDKTNEEDEKTKDIKQTNNSVFATFKKSNKSNIPQSQTDNTSNSNHNNNNVITKNKFIRKGKFSEFEFCIKPKSFEPKEAMTFSYFKQIFGNE